MEFRKYNSNFKYYSYMSSQHNSLYNDMLNNRITNGNDADTSFVEVLWASKHFQISPNEFSHLTISHIGNSMLYSFDIQTYCLIYILTFSLLMGVLERT